MSRSRALKDAQDKYRQGRQVSVVMPPGLAAKLTQLAQFTGKSKAAIALEAITAHLSSETTSMEPEPDPQALRAAPLREAYERGLDRYKSAYFSEVARLHAAGVGFHTITTMLNRAGLPTQTGHRPNAPGNVRKAFNRWQARRALASASAAGDSSA